MKEQISRKLIVVGLSCRKDMIVTPVAPSFLKEQCLPIAESTGPIRIGEPRWR